MAELITPQQSNEKMWRMVFIALAGIITILLPSLSPAYGQTGDEWLQIFYGRDIWDYFFNGDKQALDYNTLLPRYQGMETQFKGQELYGGLFDFGTEVLMSMLVLWFYPRRFEKPLIYALLVVGLFNTHNMVFPLTFGLILLYAWEVVEFKKINAKTIVAILLMLIGGLYLIPYIALPGFKLVAFKQEIPDHFAEIKKVLGNGLLVGGMSDPDILQTLALLAFFVMGICLLPRLKPFAVLLCGAAGLFYLLGYRYRGEHRHDGLLMVEILFAYGLAWYYATDKFTIPIKSKYSPYKIGTIVLAIVLFWQSRIGIAQIQAEVDTEYSDSKNAAAYMMENGLDRKILVGHQSWASFSVLQHLPRDCKMFWPDTRRWGYFIPYDSLYHVNSFRYNADYAAAVTEETFKGKLNDVVLVFNQPIESPQLNALWKPVYAGGMFGSEGEKPVKSQESYIIYVRNPQAPANVSIQAPPPGQ